jgi:hypothetical protein
MKMKRGYDIQKEYINIEGYSPFCHINEVSPKYQRDPFQLPFVHKYSEERPVHPDTFHDLGLNEKDVIKSKIVFPTSSFRTVYDPEHDLCYKLPLLRRITRSMRNLPPKELQRSERASVFLSQHPFEKFKFLPEKCHPAEDPNFNYIIREMPEQECFPWFYVIRSQKFSSSFEMDCMLQIIRSWMFLASKGVLLESPHTQNILVDASSTVYYRDLSDVRVIQDPVLRPSYYDSLSCEGEALSAIFDRTVCNQNLDHLFRYSQKLGTKERKTIKDLIESEIQKYELPFPNYSLDFPHNKPERVPQRVALVSWRDFY